MIDSAMNYECCFGEKWTIFGVYLGFGWYFGRKAYLFALFFG